MAQGPSDTILVAIRITLWIRESKVRNPHPPDRRRFVLECISCFKLCNTCSHILSRHIFTRWSVASKAALPRAYIHKNQHEQRGSTRRWWSSESIHYTCWTYGRAM